MKFTNNQLRICPKCKHSCNLAEELRTTCPKCGSQVWFYNYESISKPPGLPTQQPTDLWTNPITILTLVVIGLFGLVALTAISNQAIAVMICSFAAIGFGVFGFMRHSETHQMEERLEHAEATWEYAETMRDRVTELISRYNYLLKTGDERIEHYYNETYVQAIREQEETRKLLKRAEAAREAVKHVEDRIYAMAKRLIDDHRKWSAQKLRPDPENYQKRKLELEKMFDFVESVGYDLPKALRIEMVNKMKSDYQAIVKENTLKEEQKRMKQQMREEEKIRKERDKALQDAEDKERELQRLLANALKTHKDTHNAEIQALQMQLAEAHAKAQKAKSMAQLTKAGHVYVLSNIGSFGEGVFKVGMTRRLEPQDRVKELGDASVPFPFDVHAMISCDNAPRLENTLHKELSRFRVNRVNLRKEFFRVELDQIVEIVKTHHGKVEYIAEPEALEYRDTLTITPEELVEIEAELEELGVTIDDDDE